MISDYLASLTHALSFDPSLARCVRQEVEDHLREAVAADPQRDEHAEERAIARFGDPQALAAQFITVSLARRRRQVAAAAMLVIAGVFIAMKIRFEWFALTPYVISEDARAVGTTVVMIDRVAFLLSVTMAIAACVDIVCRRTPVRMHQAFRRQLRRFVLLCSAATAALAVSVFSDGVLTLLRLTATAPSAGLLMPTLSMTLEIAGAGLLAFLVRDITRRATASADCQSPQISP
jgi:hypothetical protein